MLILRNLKFYSLMLLLFAVGRYLYFFILLFQTISLSSHFLLVILEQLSVNVENLSSIYTLKFKMINDCNKYSFTLIILEYYLFIFFEKCIFGYVKYNFMEFVLPPVA